MVAVQSICACAALVVGTSLAKFAAVNDIKTISRTMDVNELMGWLVEKHDFQEN